MRQLTLHGPADCRWEDVPEPPGPAADAAVVRPFVVATCDLDIGVLTGNFPLPGSYPFGHEAIAEVISVGADVRTVVPGDRVIVPFQISCGTCDACLRGRTGNCLRHPPMSAYGLGAIGGVEWGGLLADLATVPHADAMLVPLPDEVDPVAVASASDNLPDAWRAVGPHLAAEPMAEVLIVGGGGSQSIGLYAAGMAVSLGAARVCYLDHRQTQLEIAAALGAEPIDGRPVQRVGEFPVVVDASGTPAGLRCALNSTAPDGTCTSAAVYLNEVPLPLATMYSRITTFRTGRAHVRPAIPRVLDLVARGFDPSKVTTMIAPWEDAPDVLADPTMKVVITRA